MNTIYYITCTYSHLIGDKNVLPLNVVFKSNNTIEIKVYRDTLDYSDLDKLLSIYNKWFRQIEVIDIKKRYDNSNKKIPKSTFCSTCHSGKR